MADEDEMLRTQNRTLERENRQLRRALRDEFAMAALTGLLSANAYTPDFVASRAFEVADSMLSARRMV